MIVRPFACGPAANRALLTESKYGRFSSAVPSGMSFGTAGWLGVGVKERQPVPCSPWASRPEATRIR